MHSTKLFWTPEARARKDPKLGPNTILAIMRHGCSILTATISRSFTKARVLLKQPCRVQGSFLRQHCLGASAQAMPRGGATSLGARSRAAHSSLYETQSFLAVFAYGDIQSRNDAVWQNIPLSGSVQLTTFSK